MQASSVSVCSGSSTMCTGAVWASASICSAVSLTEVVASVVLALRRRQSSWTATVRWISGVMQGSGSLAGPLVWWPWSRTQA